MFTLVNNSGQPKNKLLRFQQIIFRSDYEELAPDSLSAKRFMGNEQERVASINLTTPGKNAMISLQKKTGKSRKEVVSSALVQALNGSMLEPIVRFNFMEPALLTELAKAVREVIASTHKLREGFLGIRSWSDDQLQRREKVLTDMHAHLIKLEEFEKHFKGKYSLLQTLSGEDYKMLPKINNLLNNLRASAKGSADRAFREARYAFVEKLIALAMPGIEQPEKPVKPAEDGEKPKS